MIKTSFNDSWLFKRTDITDEACCVNLPHDAMIKENRIFSPTGKNVGYFEGHDYCYEKTFFVAEDMKDCKHVFEFEGVYHNSEIYINNVLASQRPYGYTNFYVDANEFIKYGDENKIKVIAKNSDQPNSRWYSGAGIYRPVWLYTLAKKHIEINGIKIRTIEYSPAKIEVSIKTNGSGKFKLSIISVDKLVCEKSGRTDGDVKLLIDIENALLWDCENPNLYLCRVEFEGDCQECQFGIRKIEVDSQNGLRINGKKTLLLGACIHHDNGVLGAVAHPFAEYRKIEILKKAGFNAIRSAHNPCSKALLDACDKLGMMVMDEYVDMWFIHKNKYDYADYFDAWWERDIADMIEKDYNHPSVIMYSIGNEVSETAQERGINYCEKMTAFIKEIDDRPVTCGINIFFNYLSSLGFGVHSDKKAEKASKVTKSTKAVGSEFFNNLAGILGANFMKIGASLRGSDRTTKDAFSKLDIAGYNYGILRYKKDFKKYPKRVIVGSETFCSDAYRFYEIARNNNALIGDFVWSGLDYIGETGVGAWEYKDYAKEFSNDAGWLTAGSGRIDITGKSLAEMAYMRVAFELDKIRMGVVPVNNAQKKHSPSAWKMSNAHESWSWNGCNGMKTRVEVYARAYSIKLYINGKLVGCKRNKKDCFVSFKVKYYDGEIMAISYDKSGEEIARTSLCTAEEHTRISLKPEKNSIDSLDDLFYVRICLTDSNNTTKPLARDNIKLTVQNGEILGLGNACPYNAKGYVGDTVETYFGEALVVIKPLSNGTVTLLASSEHSGSQSIELSCAELTKDLIR